MKTFWRLTFLFYLILSVKQTYAQTEIVDNQIWIDFIPHFKISDRAEYFGGISYRTTTDENKFRRLMVRPSVRYSWTYELDLIAGIGLFATWEAEDYMTFELRPYQGILLGWPKIWRLNFKHRGLVEERLQWNNQDEFSPTVRFRYRHKTKFSVNKQSVGYKTVYLPLSYEIFTTLHVMLFLFVRITLNQQMMNKIM